MDPAQLKKVLKYKEIKSNFGFHSDGKTFALEKYQRFHAEGCVKHNDCIFSTKVGALIALEIETNGAHLGKNKASPCSSSLQGTWSPQRHHSACGTGSWEFLGIEAQGNTPWGKESVPRQSPLLFVQHPGFNWYSSNCSRGCDPENGAELTQTPKYRCKNSREENLEGEDGEAVTQQNLSRRFPAVSRFYQYLLCSFAT